MSEQVPIVSDADTNSADTIVGSFGVGCFHFGYKSDNDEMDYTEQLRLFLNGYPNLDRLEMDVPTSFRGSWDAEEVEGDDLLSGKGIAPWPAD